MIRPRSLSALCTLALACACCALARADDNWPQLRGSQSLGVADHQNLPDKWTTTDNVAWKTDLPGRGWSSPVVWGSRIFVTTVVNQGESEEPKKGLYFGGNRLEPSKSPHVWKVICLDLESGQVRWEKTAHEGIPSTPIHLKNSYASETPVTDGERVYAYFGNVGVFCYDLEGKELWQYKVEPHAMRYGWGTAASPVLHEGRLYIVNDNDDASYLLALDAKTGQEVWKVARDEKSNWATPFVWNNGARTEIVTPGTGKVRSYDLAGNLLWELGGMSSITIATPYSQYGLLYLSSGYVMDKKRPLLAVKPGAVGDISLTDEQTSNDYVAWCQKEGGPYNPTTIVYDGIVYVLYDRGLFAAFDAHTGEPVYERQRLPEGKAFTSSPWAYDGKIYCLNEDGLCFVIKAGREFEILHTNALAEDDMCMATPATVRDRLLIRTAARMYCLRQGAKLEEPKK